ncbi:PTS transporter subunit EIIB [Serratia sp. L9]|uniref:PTS transporter subunit EIIB n=1 Tax=Serratia sp. L9 TaxID=3423946 RepID=UPI003D6710AE
MADSALLNNKEYDKVAELVVEGLGGKQNIKRVENCVSRLRIDLGDQKLMNMELLKEAGSLGTFIPSSNHIHVVFGPHVEFVRNAVDDHLAGIQQR